MFKFFKEKRKQCKECFKTFYNTEHIYDYEYDLSFEVCPYCGGGWIEV